MGALRVLVKPHDWTRGAVEHRRPEQPWPAGAAAHVAEAFGEVRQRLAMEGVVHFPPAGDFHFLAELPASQQDAARALALVVSSQLPGVWLTLDRLFVRDGCFFRRERGFKFNLVEAMNVRLPRGVRAKLKGLL